MQKLRTKKREERRSTHKAVTFGTTSVLIGDNDSLEDITKGLEMTAKSVALSLPGEATNKDLGEGCVTERRVGVVKRRARNRLIRHGQGPIL